MDTYYKAVKLRTISPVAVAVKVLLLAFKVLIEALLTQC